MPINVYIAPFVWYEKKKQLESTIYRQMVLDSLDAWRKATNGLVRFNVVNQLNQSQMDIKWRRVDRKSLGHTTYEMDKIYRMFSCEIQIGISDGLLHAAYQDAGEVQHTILHEIGHALGLIGHSDNPRDIMYVPHQYGVHQLSPRDIESVLWLYSLPVGFQYRNVATKYCLPPNYTLNDVIDAVERRLKGEPEPVIPLQEEGPKPVEMPPPVQRKQLIRNTQTLDEQHEILSEMGRFYLKTQNIQIDQQKQLELRKAMMQKRQSDRFLPPDSGA